MEPILLFYGIWVFFAPPIGLFGHLLARLFEPGPLAAFGCLIPPFFIFIFPETQELFEVYETCLFCPGCIYCSTNLLNGCDFLLRVASSFSDLLEVLYLAFALLFRLEDPDLSPFSLPVTLLARTLAVSFELSLEGLCLLLTVIEFKLWKWIWTGLVIGSPDLLLLDRFL